MDDIEITVFRKAGGLPLTKRISLNPNGSLKSDGSACTMSAGTALRFAIDDIGKLVDLIDSFGPDQALALGALRPDLPDRVNVVTKRKLNGGAAPDTIARTQEFFIFRDGVAALGLIDYDVKGMPQSVADRIALLGGFWPALVSVCPELADIARVSRKSTSAGIYRADTCEQLLGSGGEHVFIALKDGADVERFLLALHQRCWLARLGWYMVGTAGQLLERSIVDRVVGQPERLVFEGPPVLVPPLAQDRASRKPSVIGGKLLDTAAVCRPLSIVENSRLKELLAKDAARVRPEAEATRKAYIAARAADLAERARVSHTQAAEIINSQCNGILLPDVVLPFDDEDLAGSTVRDVLAAPEKFIDATLADPIEGVQYGAGKAKVMQHADGLPWIHSFAHGCAVYALRYDVATAKTLVEAASAETAVDVFIRCVLASTFNPAEVEALRNLAAKISGIGRRAISAMLKEARQKQAVERARARRERRMEQRPDPRPTLDLPLDGDEWLPMMTAVNEVLGAADSLMPPARDRDRDAASVTREALLSLHLLTKQETNIDDDET
jgi:hypothetical protein